MVERGGGGGLYVDSPYLVLSRPLPLGLPVVDVHEGKRTSGGGACEELRSAWHGRGSDEHSVKNFRINGERLPRWTAARY